MSEWNSETAEWYADKYGEYATNRLAVDELYLPNNAIVVDIGCGTGAALRHASSKFDKGSLIGIDPVPRMIEIAREKTSSHSHASRIEFREGSAENVPVEDELADIVFAFDTLDHWQDVGQGLKEVHRILRPGGKLVIVKDGDVPGATKARKGLPDILKQAGFLVLDQRELSGEAVRFTLWICNKPDEVLSN
jgi:ubiquinone/menaquinone biosynthesis C-methylase UbiE